MMMEQYARMLFIHQIHEGKPLDVTQDHPELEKLIKWAEKEELIEVDVKGYRYKLTKKGEQLYEEQLSEAQDLIRRYDIYADVDVDQNGKARFDSGLGDDLRVPVYELNGIDPFRARFLLGLNDEEWKELDWTSHILDEKWYDSVFHTIETAPGLEDVGEERLRSIIEQGKEILRHDPATTYFSH